MGCGAIGQPPRKGAGRLRRARHGEECGA